MGPDHRFVGYSDESRYNCGRYRSIALVSLEERLRDSFDDEIRKILDGSTVRELKWFELKSAKEKFAVIKLFEFLIPKAVEKLLRVDVLIWDTHDRAHIANNNDVIANLERMYYHLYKNVLRERWPDGSEWHLYPDEHAQMDWKSVNHYLSRVSVELDIEPTVFRGWNFKATLRTEFQIQRLQECKSCDTPLVQVADIFAGIATYSRDKYHVYESWLRLQSWQHELFQQNPVQQVHVSNADKHRLEVLERFNRICKSYKLGVSLESENGLHTYQPKYPINFWLFKPALKKTLSSG